MPECKECLIKLSKIVLTVIDLAIIFGVFFVLLSRDCWQIRFHVPLVCLWILGFFIFPALSCEGRFSFFHSQMYSSVDAGYSAIDPLMLYMFVFIN